MVETRRGRRHNAHVRARRAIMRRTVDRAYDWRVHRRNRQPNLDDSSMLELAAAALASYTWEGLCVERCRGISVSRIHALVVRMCRLNRGLDVSNA